MEITDVPLSAITVSDFNARKDLSSGIEDAGIRELADSIRVRGLLSPITVRRRGDGGFELIAGQRRLLACQQLEMRSIPAIVRDDLDDTDATVISLVENVHRADMSPIDKARAYDRIHDRYGTHAEVARQTGVSAQTVKKYLSLLALHPAIQEQISTSQGPVGVAAMSRLSETFAPGRQVRALEMIGGFKQDIQVAILKASGGDIDRLEELRESALSGAFDARLCRDGLCFVMPDDLKSLIGALAEDQPGDFEMAIRSLAATRAVSDGDGGPT